jgi:hypothetical protein
MLNQKKLVKDIFSDYIVKDNNIFFIERLFVANTILNWAYENYKDQKQIKAYIDEIKRHLDGEITLYWSDGIVKVRREKRGKI